MIKHPLSADYEDYGEPECYKDEDCPAGFRCMLQEWTAKACIGNRHL